jgi:hypothetical protein
MRGRHGDGLDVPTRAQVPLVEVDAVVLAQGIRSAQAADARSDDGRLHSRLVLPPCWSMAARLHWRADCTMMV